MNLRVAKGLELPAVGLLTTGYPLLVTLLPLLLQPLGSQADAAPAEAAEHDLQKALHAIKGAPSVAIAAARNRPRSSPCPFTSGQSSRRLSL